MAATFTYAARYQAEATCKTPLRTGGADGDTELVLRNREGQAYVQGTAIAGALRGWLEANVPTAVDSLFGSQTCAGHLIVSDGVFSSNAEKSIRPRLRIDGSTCSAADGGKFDVAQVNANAKLTFELIWLGTAEMASELDTVEELLCALHSGAICLGAQKTNGFGQVTLSVKKCVYDLKQAQDREAWLADRYSGHNLALKTKVDSNRVLFTVTGHADSILVKAAASAQSDGGSYTANLEEGTFAILPGSSVKGTVRARVSAIAKLLHLDDELVSEFFGRGAVDGDTGKQGQIRFEDVRLSGEKRKISRIRINRFTGGVIRGGLFTEEPLSCDITLRIAAPVNQPLACGLLLYALRDLGLGLYNLGSGGAIGRGYMQVETIAAQMPDGKRGCLRFRQDGSCGVEDDSKILQNWLDAVGGIAHEN